jgi:hypothetical protein
MRLKNITEEDQNKEIDVNDVNLEAPSRASELSAVEIEDTQIRHLAYSLWEERGSPHGSSEDDWFKAKQRLQYGERSRVLAVGNT